MPDMPKPRVRAYGNCHWGFKCPGCFDSHLFKIRDTDPPGERGLNPVWMFNDDPFLPTFNPSMRVIFEVVVGQEPKHVCHFNVTDGKIVFHPDSTHALTGQTIDLPEIQA